MSSFFRSRKLKPSSSRDKKSQNAGDGLSNTSRERTQESDAGASLFSGMTVTANLGTASDNQSLMSHTDVTPVNEKTQEQSSLIEIDTENTQDLTAVLARPDMELLPELIQPSPIPQQVGQSTTKKKKTRHMVRPGYARQPDSKGDTNEQNDDVVAIEEKVCDPVEQGKAEIHEDATNAENNAGAERPNPETLTPLYSIGTPSTSDENLFEDVTAQTGNDTPTGISREEPLKDEVQLKIFDQSQNGNLRGDLTDGQLEAGAEMTKLEKSLERLEGSGDIEECETFLDSIENPTGIPNVNANDSFAGTRYSMLGSAHDRTVSCWSDSNEQAKPGLKHMTGDVNSASDLEWCNLDLSQENVHSLYGTSEKLRFALQHLKSQLTMLSEDKRSLNILEEDLLQMYTGSHNAESLKEQQLKELQLEESQALAGENYDLAEEISDRMEQLKEELEYARYRLPAQDNKVERALKLRAEIAEKEADIYRQSQATLQEVREEQQECLASHKEISSAWSAKEKQRLNSDRQRLERTMDHLKLDKEHMQAANKELSKEVLQKTEEFQTRKEEVILQRGLLQREISALEAKLAKLRKEEAEFTNAIKEEENKIESVKAEFSPQQEALDKQQQEIEKRERSLQEEFELLSFNQKEFDDQTEEKHKREQELAGVVSSASDELEKSEQTIKWLEEQQRSAQEFLTMKHFTFDADSKLASLHVELKEVSQKITSLSNKIQLGERSVATLRKTLNEVESQISDLDAAKEIAKKEKQFKQAKRLKEERDALTQEGIQSQEKLERLLKELAEDKKSLEKAQQESADLEAEISEKDRLAAVVTVEKASAVIQVLQEQINRIGDDSLVKALLETEAKTCRNLVSDLCNKHDIPKPELAPSQVESQDHDINENSDAASRPLKSSEDEIFEEQKEDCDKLLDKLSELEGRLEAVVEVEDFDEAELQQEITKLQDMIEQTKSSQV